MCAAPAIVAARPMATLIESFDALSALTHVNGVPLDEIDKRAQPNPAMTPGKGMSQAGFVAAGESFKDVLVRDWTTIAALGLTHTELGEHLNRIIFKQGKAHWYEATDTIDYNYGELPSSRLADLASALTTAEKAGGAAAKAFACISRLKISVLQFGGHQEDLFRVKDPSKGPMGAMTILDESEMHWCRDFTITNETTGKSVKVPYGLIAYIKKLGFYEGSTDYRVDPLVLISVITGLETPSLEAFLKAKASS